MWDRPDVLNRTADLLVTLAFLLTLGGTARAIAHSPLFALREVHLLGTISHVTREEVAELMRREIRGNLVTMDLAMTRTSFERLPWVRRAVVRRQWPGRLEVQLEEYVPLAHWGAGTLVSTRGELFKADFAGELPEFSGSPELAKEIAIQYQYFRTALATIGRRPLQVSVSSRRAWEIRLDGGTVVELGREHVEARLARFVAVYSRTIARMNRRIEYVDLRYPSGFAVRIPELRDGAPRAKPKGRT